MPLGSDAESQVGGGKGDGSLHRIKFSLFFSLSENKFRFYSR